MRILAIETSCDDTGIAILQENGGKFDVLSNIVSSQPIHQNYGGVFPMMAKREHQNNLVPVLTQALKEAKLLETANSTLEPEKLGTIKQILEKESNLFESVKAFLETYGKPDVDAIAVTHGPGLEPCLWVGINVARVLSYIWELPLIPVNHIEAHILVNFLPKINENSKSQSTNHNIEFPAISLVVSGGHTQLILVKDIGNYEIIGETRDDAAGECFDKCAKLLGLGYPGGPIIALQAEQWKLQIPNPKLQIVLPRPMMHSKDFNFSFSGLKTAVLYKIRDLEPKISQSKQFTNEMCVAVQDAICDVLIKKTLAAAKEYGIKTIILGGGVSANHQLRKRFTGESPVPVIFPEAKLSTDNGLMIAMSAYFNQAKKIAWQELSADANLRIG